MRRPVTLLCSVISVAITVLTSIDTQARTRNGFDLANATIPITEIRSGGTPRDGIPSIDRPTFAAAMAADFMAAEDRILGVQVNGQTRAYPIKILNWHEIVNDRLGTQHIVVTYCPLCGTGMVFASNINIDSNNSNAALIFGVSGLLYNSDMLLYDRNTESLWSQIRSEAISGPLAGTRLPQLPARHTTWSAWRARYPDTLVLSTNTGFRRDYEQSPYDGYEQSRRLYFQVSSKAPADYHPKSMILGISLAGVSRAYPFDELETRDAATFTEQLAGQRIQVHWDKANRSAYVTDDSGKELPSTLSYWFAWYAFHPATSVFKGD